MAYDMSTSEQLRHVAVYTFFATLLGCLLVVCVLYVCCRGCAFRCCGLGLNIPGIPICFGRRRRVQVIAQTASDKDVKIMTKATVMPVV